MSLLTIQQLSHRYNNFYLRDINLAVHNNEVVYLIGNSGCGKSTILKLIIGLEKPESGTISLEGQTLSSSTHFIPPEKRGIAITFQHPSLFPHKTVIENVIFATRDSSKAEKYKSAISALKEVGMDKYAEYFPQSISGGQQQLVTIARTLVQKPKLILLDEPFSSLDTILRKKIRRKMLDILKSHKIPAIIVSHDPDEALEVASRIYVMRNGEIIQEGSPYDVYYSPVDAHSANFFGIINKISGSVEKDTFISIWGKIPITDSSKVIPYVRPEAILLANQREGIKAKVISVSFFNRIVEIEVKGEIYHIKFMIALLPKKGDIIYITLDKNQVLFLSN